MTQKTMDALASAIYVARLTATGQTITDDDQRIRASGVFPDWAAGAHTVGEIYNAPDLSDQTQTWECYQAYDNAVYPDIIPGNAAWFTFNRPLHGKSKETARPWVAPTHSMDIYKSGEYMIWTDGTVYCCIAANGTNYSPSDYPGGWEIVE